VGIWEVGGIENTSFLIFNRCRGLSFVLTRGEAELSEAKQKKQKFKRQSLGDLPFSCFGN
jgi:hypothetical protein